MHYYKAIRVTVLIVAACCHWTAKAVSPDFAYQYERYSENQNFFFKSIPFFNYALTDFGKTIVYDNHSKQELYRIDNYLPSGTFISNTGKTLVSTRYWRFGQTNIESLKLVEVFIDGKSTKSYYLNDLILDKSCLETGELHMIWYNAMAFRNDTLYIKTIEEKLIIIELDKGEIIGKKDITEVKNWDSLLANPAPKTHYYSKIKYPLGYIFPDLKSGKKFRETLIKKLKKNEVKEYVDCKYYILIQGAIDRNGQCEIFMLKISINGPDDKTHEETIRSQITKWVTKQKYQTELIPINCDKWVFQERFFLK